MSVYSMVKYYTVAEYNTANAIKLHKKN